MIFHLLTKPASVIKGHLNLAHPVLIVLLIAAEQNIHFKIHLKNPALTNKIHYHSRIISMLWPIGYIA